MTQLSQGRVPEHLAFRAFRFTRGSASAYAGPGVGRASGIAELYHTLQISQARVTFTIFRFAGRSAEAETLRFRSCVDAWARTCRGVLDTDSEEGDATMGALCGSDDALTDAPPAAAGSPSWLLRRCTPNIFGRETEASGRAPDTWISAAGLEASTQGLTAAIAASLHPGARANRVPKGRGRESKSFSDDERKSSRVAVEDFGWVFLGSSVHAILAGSLWGKTGLSRFGAGWFRKSPSRVGRGASSNQRHIRLHKSGNEVHIFMRGPRVVRTPSHHNSLGKKLGPCQGKRTRKAGSQHTGFHHCRYFGGPGDW